MYDFNPEQILMALQAFRWAYALCRGVRAFAGRRRPPGPGAPGTRSRCSCDCHSGGTE